MSVNSQIRILCESKKNVLKEVWDIASTNNWTGRREIVSSLVLCGYRFIHSKYSEDKRNLVSNWMTFRRYPRSTDDVIWDIRVIVNLTPTAELLPHDIVGDGAVNNLVWVEASQGHFTEPTYSTETTGNLTAPQHAEHMFDVALIHNMRYINQFNFVKHWVHNICEEHGVENLSELNLSILKDEINQMHGTASNERLVMYGDSKENEEMHLNNLNNMSEYTAQLIDAISQK